MTVEDSIRAEILEEKLSSNLYPFWNITPMLSLKKKVLDKLVTLLWL